MTTSFEHQYAALGSAKKSKLKYKEKGALIWNWLKRQSIINKLAIASGIAFIACVFWLRAGSYFDGLSFDKSWATPMIILPASLISVTAFIGFSLVHAGSAEAKRNPRPSIAVFLSVPLFAAAIYLLPLPSFTDGLRDIVSEKFDREQLVAFAEGVRELNVGQMGYGRNQEQLNLLITRYPQEMSMSSLPPRVAANDNAVLVYYGGALVKHWGYAVVNDDKCPVSYLPPERCRKVFDNIWVYHDIW